VLVFTFFCRVQGVRKSSESDLSDNAYEEENCCWNHNWSSRCCWGCIHSGFGGAPVPVPGSVRLVLEFLILGAAFLAMNVNDLVFLSLIFISLVIIHYILAHERIKWLLDN